MCGEQSYLIIALNTAEQCILFQWTYSSATFLILLYSFSRVMKNFKLQILRTHNTHRLQSDSQQKWPAISPDTFSHRLRLTPSLPNCCSGSWQLWAYLGLQGNQGWSLWVDCREGVEIPNLGGSQVKMEWFQWVGCHQGANSSSWEFLN